MDEFKAIKDMMQRSEEVYMKHMLQKPREAHTCEFIEEAGLIDLCKCSCGWLSSPYYDGREYAYRDWRKHVESSKNKGLDFWAK